MMVSTDVNSYRQERKRFTCEPLRRDDLVILVIFCFLPFHIFVLLENPRIELFARVLRPKCRYDRRKRYSSRSAAGGIGFGIR